MNKNTIYYSIFLITFFFGIIFFGSKCQKESVPEPTLDKSENTLTARAPGDTIYRPIAYGGTLKVYPYTIVPCINKKTKKREYQVVMYGDTVLPCKYQQQKQYDKINISDTALINPNTKMYICIMEIK